MSENLKIRFRLPNGEEFEAEGPQDFIETQRTYFLRLVGRATSTSNNNQVPLISRPSSAARPLPAELSLTPSLLRHRPAKEPTEFSSGKQTALDDKNHLWEELIKREGEMLILRRKSHLTAQEAALLILAGAKHLVGADNYRAILLSKSLQESGFEIGRLDRLLGDLIKESYISAQGSKRSRSYQLTPTGFARAFVLAEKRIGEIN